MTCGWVWKWVGDRVGDGIEFEFRDGLEDSVGGVVGHGERTGIRGGPVTSASHTLCSLPPPRFLVLSQLHEFLVHPGDPGCLDLGRGNDPASDLLPQLAAKHLAGLFQSLLNPSPTQINNLYF